MIEEEPQKEFATSIKCKIDSIWNDTKRIVVNWWPLLISILLGAGWLLQFTSNSLHIADRFSPSEVSTNKKPIPNTLNVEPFSHYDADNSEKLKNTLSQQKQSDSVQSQHAKASIVPDKAQLRNCDRFAANKSDPGRHPDVKLALSLDELVPELAITACEDALQEFPLNARYQYQLGRSLHAQHDKSPTSEAALNSYKQLLIAQQNGHLHAAINISELVRGSTSSLICAPKKACIGLAIDVSTDSAVAGSEDAGIMLGDIYRTEDPQNLPCTDRERCDLLAMTNYSKWLGTGTGVAEAKLGWLLYKEKPTNFCAKNDCPSKSIDYYKTAVKAGVGWAAKNLAFDYKENNPLLKCVSQEACTSKAYDLFKMAADKGEMVGARQMGLIALDDGNAAGCGGNEQNSCHMAASTAFNHARALGDKLADAYIAWLKTERSTPQFCPDQTICDSEAFKLLENYKNNEFSWPKRLLGNLYWKNSPSVDCTDARNCKSIGLQLYKTASSEGDAFSAFKLGRIFADEQAVTNCTSETDCLVKAISSMTEAAKLGRSDAYSSWGSYLIRLDCPPSECKARVDERYEVGEEKGFWRNDLVMYSVSLKFPDATACQPHEIECKSVFANELRRILATNDKEYIERVFNKTFHPNDKKKSCPKAICDSIKTQLLLASQRLEIENSDEYALHLSKSDDPLCKSRPVWCVEIRQILLTKIEKSENPDWLYGVWYSLSTNNEITGILPESALERAAQLGSPDAVIKIQNSNLWTESGDYVESLTPKDIFKIFAVNLSSNNLWLNSFSDGMGSLLALTLNQLRHEVSDEVKAQLYLELLLWECHQSKCNGNAHSWIDSEARELVKEIQILISQQPDGKFGRQNEIRIKQLAKTVCQTSIDPVVCYSKRAAKIIKKIEI